MSFDCLVAFDVCLIEAYIACGIRFVVVTRLGGWKTDKVSLNPRQEQYISLIQNFQTVPTAYPPTYSVDNLNFRTGVKI